MSKARSSSGPIRPSARRTVHSPLPRAGTPPPAPVSAAPAGEVDDEATDDLPPALPSEPPPPSSSGALRIALNRPISLAEVRAVQTEQTALASEATYVGPPNK